MPKNDIEILKDCLIKYIEATTILEKREILDACKNKLPEKIKIIDRIHKIIDSPTKETAKKIIDCIFLSETIDEALLTNLESQLYNKTGFNMEVLHPEEFEILQMNGLELLHSTEILGVKENNKVEFQNQSLFLIPYKDTDTIFNNYIIDLLLNLPVKSYYLAKKGNDTYLMASHLYSTHLDMHLIKEESLINTRDIEGFINQFSETTNLIKIIFIDLLTNQNYRKLDKEYTVLNSDSTQNDYYVINNKTMKKKAVLESLYLNFYEEIKDISQLIADNYDKIIDFITDLLASKKNVNEKYLLHLRNNVVTIFEMERSKKRLDAIYFEKNMEVYDETRENANKKFEENLESLRQNLQIKRRVLSKGYVSIFTLLFSIILFGISLAYVILNK